MNESPADEPSLEMGDQPPLMGIRPSLEKIHRALQESFREEIQASGGAKIWLRQRCPRSFASVVGMSLSTDDEMTGVVMSETRAFWIGLEIRLSECAECPPNGAACHDTSDRLPPGVLVRLFVKDGSAQSSLRQCERFQDFKLAQRLEQSGVDARFSMVKLAHLGTTSERLEATKCFERFLASNCTTAPRRANLLIQGKRASEYGVALFRNAMKCFQNALYRSVHVPSLIRECRSAMTAKEVSPLDALLPVDVLVLDDVDAACLKNTYFMPEIKWVYERRRDQGLATIITARVDTEGLFSGTNLLKVE